MNCMVPLPAMSRKSQAIETSIGNGIRHFVPETCPGCCTTVIERLLSGLWRFGWWASYCETSREPHGECLRDPDGVRPKVMLSSSVL